MPKFVSAEASDLIKRILNPDPAKRFVIEDIKRHTWFGTYKVSDYFIMTSNNIRCGKEL
jgi:hypothetical protein